MATNTKASGHARPRALRLDPVEITGEQPTSVGTEPATPTQDNPPIGDEKPIYRSNKVFETVVHGEEEKAITAQALREAVTEPHDSAVDNVLRQFVTIPHDEAVGYYVLPSPPPTRTAPPHDGGTPTAERTRSAAAPQAADKRTINEIVDGAISVLERRGFPVKFLRDIRKHNYKFSQQEGSSEPYTSPWFDKIVLPTSDVEHLKSMTSKKVWPSRAIGTLYHESVHAYLSSHSRDPMVAGLKTLACLDYNGSSLTSSPNGTTPVGVADDPERIFTEAAAEYVESRVSAWWNTFALLTVYAQDKDVKVELLEEELRKLESSYNEGMKSRVFGYEDEGGPFNRQHAWTTVPIRQELKRFLDLTILEGRIQDIFRDDPTFRELSQTVERRIPRRSR